MRWKEKPRPANGDKRVKRVWLLFPKCVAGEWRWLETAWIRQEFVGRTMLGWISHDWI